MKVGGLFHHVFAGQVVAALVQHVYYRRRVGGAIDVAGVCLVAARIIFVHETDPPLVAVVLLPLGVGRILQVKVGHNALGDFQTGRLQGSGDRIADAAQDVQRLPLDLRRLLDRLGGEFGDRGVDEDVATCGL